MKNILIRARGNNNIGMGHIVRCLALANELKKQRSVNIIFITEDKVAEDLIKRSGFVVISPNGNDFVCIKKIVNGKTLLITDILYTSKKYVTELKKIKNLNIINIDNNTKLKKTGADILINANIFFGKGKISGKEKILLGPKYMILRREFGELAKKKIKTKNNVKIITIISGGADKKKLVLTAARALEKIKKNIEINLILGPACSCIDEVKSFVKKAGKRFNLMISPKNLIEVMRRSDLAITAAGVTLYEFASIGVPCIVVPLAKHQEDIAYNFGKERACINLGKGLSARKIIESTMGLLENKEARNKLAKRAKNFVDGRGMERVKKIILSL